jgi:hypothetical protein
MLLMIDQPQARFTTSPATTIPVKSGRSVVQA